MSESESALRKLVDEQNAMQPGKPAQPEVPAGCKAVVILTAGPYNDRHNKAQKLQPGDTLVTKAWYAQTLVDLGLADWPEEG